MCFYPQIYIKNEIYSNESLPSTQHVGTFFYHVTDLMCVCTQNSYIEMYTHHVIIAEGEISQRSSGLDEVQFSLVQLVIHVQLFLTLWTTACQASLSFTNSRSLLKLMSIESLTPSNNLILCHPLLSPTSIFPSIRVFPKESGLHIRWPKYWSFRFSIGPSNEYSGLISFRMDWLDLLEVQGTLKSLPQQHSSKASILQCSAFFIVQISHPYMTTGKTKALTR